MELRTCVSGHIIWTERFGFSPGTFDGGKLSQLARPRLRSDDRRGTGCGFARAPFRQPPRGRSAAATFPEGGGKGVVRNGLRLSKSGVQPLRHRLAGDRRRHLPLHRGGFIVSPASGASAAVWKRGGNRSPGLLRGSGLGDTMRLPGARHQNIKLSGHQDTRDRGGTCHG